eukprot:gb/GECG01008050.1/.p1 GENE.gb/GECG01008050.1/~~gb/GECG01008050.1/.p1  ORF type:complete len:128 (+),score=16.85 gb/GECG01008050.1/:1-384(+)
MAVHRRDSMLVEGILVTQTDTLTLHSGSMRPAVGSPENSAEALQTAAGIGTPGAGVEHRVVPFPGNPEEAFVEVDYHLEGLVVVHIRSLSEGLLAAASLQQVLAAEGKPSDEDVSPFRTVGGAGSDG